GGPQCPGLAVPRYPVEAYLRTCGAESTPSDLSVGGRREARGTHGLRADAGRGFSPDVCPARSRFKRHQASRSSRRTTDQIRAGDQPENREGARNHYSTIVAVTCGRGAPVITFESR